ncbi:hypothetical protein LTR50_000616 [Elasticomyces elasticus]|nr:hypothetical protein LTR50_000616 [Elasticomyces elasticus]
MEETVQISKSHFEALIRRAHLSTGTQQPVQTSLGDVSISRPEYEGLLRSARAFETLKAALFRGGISADTLDLLLSSADEKNDSPVNADPWNSDLDDYKNGKPAICHSKAAPVATFAPSNEIPWRRAGVRLPSSSNGCVTQNGRFSQQQGLAPLQRVSTRETSFNNSGSSLDERNENRGVADIACGITQSVPSSEDAQRTLFFKGLSDRTTYKDLISILRGGKLLDITLRGNQTATVTFYEGAADFLAYTKRNDIYLLTKRIEVKWNDRQFKPNKHVADKIASCGASRNIVISGSQGKLTEQNIRDDMEHIKNLVIISVAFRMGDIYVSTNSVHNALYARTCMTSRGGGYKGCQFGWYPDECDVPLPAARHHTQKENVASVPARSSMSMVNRYNMLNLEGTEDGSDEANGENVPPSDRSVDEDTVAGASHPCGVSLDWSEA